MKLNEQIIKLEENVAILITSKKHAETELMKVEKSMLEERDELLAHLTENNVQKEKLEENMVTLRSEKDLDDKHIRDVEKIEESLLRGNMICWYVALRRELRKMRIV